MNNITKEKIASDCYGKMDIIMHITIIVLSILFMIFPFTQDFSIAERVSMLVILSIIVGIPFLLFLGVIPLVRICTISSMLKQNRYTIVTDTVVDVQKSTMYIDAYEDTQIYIVKFENANQKCKKEIKLYKDITGAVAIGDKFDLVFLNGIDKLIAVYRFDKKCDI